MEVNSLPRYTRVYSTNLKLDSEMSRLRFIAFSIVATFPLFALAEDPEWGHLSGRFLYDGEPPKTKTLRVTNDTAAFGETVADESLIVHEKNRGIANIIVYLLPGDDEDLAVHPAYASSANSKVPLVMQDGRFVPHILLLRTTQTMTQHNKDRVGHNVRIDVFRNAPIGLTLPAADSIELQYNKEEPVPCTMSCAIHPWMRGFVLLRSNPYMAKTDADGRFSIKNLPAGDHVFRVWHERAGHLRNVRIGSLKTDPKGRLTINVRKGANKLSATRLPPKMFSHEE